MKIEEGKMVNYSKEFIQKCKRIYPNEETLQSALESRVWIAQEILGDLFTKYKQDFVNSVIDHDFSFEMMKIKINDLRVANKLQSESKSFE
jgi:hypothetical protein